MPLGSSGTYVPRSLRILNSGLPLPPGAGVQDIALGDKDCWLDHTWYLGKRRDGEIRIRSDAATIHYGSVGTHLPPFMREESGFMARVERKTDGLEVTLPRDAEVKAVDEQRGDGFIRPDMFTIPVAHLYREAIAGRRLVWEATQREL